MSANDPKRTLRLLFFRNANLSRYDMAGEVWDEHETARVHCFGTLYKHRDVIQARVDVR